MPVNIVNASVLVKIDDTAYYVVGEDKVIDRPFQIGDMVKYTSNRSYNISYNSLTTVTEVSIGSPSSRIVSYNGNYYVVNYARLKVSADKYNRHRASSFELSIKGTQGTIEMPSNSKTLAIGVDRPCLVFELDTDSDTGATSIRDAKKGKPFDSMTAAKAWVEEQIVTSIREHNVYPKYSVYEERFVGRAEKPPVVFE